MRHNEIIIDLKDWPLDQPLPSRQVPRAEELEAMLKAVRKSLLSDNLSRDQVEDIAVTAVGKTYEHWHFSEQSWNDLTGYAVTVARNAVAQHFRNTAKEAPLGEQVLDRLISTDEPEYSNIYLRDWLSKLPQADQELIQLKIQGSTQADIAKQLGVSQARVSQRLDSLEKRLRKYLLWR